MTKANNKIKKGFTIIEVVLVLAIAGLIRGFTAFRFCGYRLLR